MRETPRNKFGDLLKKLRLEAHLTQKDLAARSGISRTYVIMLEKSEAPAPSDQVTQALENALGVSRGTLLDVSHLERSPRDVQERLASLEAEVSSERERREGLESLLIEAVVEGSFQLTETSAAQRFREALREAPELKELWETPMNRGGLARGELQKRLVREALRSLPSEVTRRLAEALREALEARGDPGKERTLQNLKAQVTATLKSNTSRVSLRRLPLLSRTAAGDPKAYTDADYPPGFAEESVAVPSDIGDPHAFALRIEGDSMEPVYSHGDIVIVSPSTLAEEGMHVVAKLATEEITCKTLHYEKDFVVLSAENSRYEPKRYGPGETLWLYPVVKSIRDDLRRFAISKGRKESRVEDQEQ